MSDLEALITEAEDRYLNDAEFHAVVYASVEAVVPETIYPGVNAAMKEAATSAASLALIFKEKDIYGTDGAPEVRGGPTR